MLGSGGVAELLGLAGTPLPGGPRREGSGRRAPSGRHKARRGERYQRGKQPQPKHIRLP